MYQTYKSRRKVATKIFNLDKCFHIGFGFGDSTDLGDNRVKRKFTFSNFFRCSL